MVFPEIVDDDNDRAEEEADEDTDLLSESNLERISGI